MELAARRCEACNKGTKKLTSREANDFIKLIGNGWHILWGSNQEPEYITKSYDFKDYVEALMFVVKISLIAEKENHHPDLEFGWGYVEVSIQTHAIKGLSQNDFILAAKIDQLKES